MEGNRKTCYNPSMLAFRRIIAFSSRIHSYLLALYIFFALLFVIFLFLPVVEPIVTFVALSQKLIGWTILLEGAWIIIASIYQMFDSAVLCFQPIILTLLRASLYYAISFILDVLNTAIVEGVTFGGGI